MNILFLFEESGTGRDYAINRGHYAISVDLMPGRGEHCACHDEIDAFEFMETANVNFWDLVIAHPPCTGLSVSGNHVYAEGKPKHQMRMDSIAFVEKVWNLPFKRMCLENPVGVLSSRSTLGKPQYIQPYDFGEDASKKTGLWLKGLPPLIRTKRISGRIVNGVERWSNQTDSGQNKLGPSPTRARERSKTYQGIAEAMIDQWT
ncbi:DNA cytosine methyltransferase [Candidatus Pacearchaeota archaeon]|nr:DNA cytosine methyltransferase [Candidatus Pacearchaeota archaeon]